nr:MAG TPA: hypothetical protein [Caudoviricetes sp.]
MTRFARFFLCLLPTCKRVCILTFLQTGGRVCYSYICRIVRITTSLQERMKEG